LRTVQGTGVSPRDAPHIVASATGGVFAMVELSVQAAFDAEASVAERHLLLVHQPGAQDRRDFEEIAAIVRHRASDIAVFIASNEIPSAVTRKKAAKRPTLVFSPLYLRDFAPQRGKVYAGQLLTKRQQMERFIAAGLPVPPFWFKGSDAPPEPAILGGHVLVKSAELGASLGSGIVLMRTAAALSKVDHLGEVFLQRYIDTGVYPAWYRVYTIFGRPVAAHKNSSTVKRAPLDGSDEELAKSVVQARRATGQTKTLCHEADVLTFAGEIYSSIPEVAFQACDIIREEATGRLYVLEINPGGNTWVFSRENTARVIAELGGYDIKQQFNAFETIAEVLIERTRLEAQ
jgi:hypothetical protein